MQLIQKWYCKLGIHIYTVTLSYAHVFGASSLNALDLSTLPFALSRDFITAK